MELQVTGTLTVATNRGQFIIPASEFDFDLEESYEESSGTENVARATYEGDGFTVVATIHEYPPLIISQKHFDVSGGTVVANNLLFDFTEPDDNS